MYQFKSAKDFDVAKESTFIYNDLKIAFATLSDGKVIIEIKSIFRMLKANPLELNDVPQAKGWMAVKKWDNSLYLQEVPEFLISILNTTQNESLIQKTKELLKNLSYIALKSFTGEKDTVIDNDPIKEPTFDELLGALMKVPPPKNEKKKIVFDMELKTFIKNALLNIVEGVEDANKVSDRFLLSGHIHGSSGQSGQKVDFDISVMINESSENDINGGIKVASLLNLGTGNKKIESNQNVHKLKFEVFVTEK